MKQRVLFLCTGNSCRSQMAEGLLKHLSKDQFNVFNAGLEPSVVNPNAVKVMKEIGIDISYFVSKDVSQFIEQPFDFVITVCDNANEHCPYFPGEVKRIHWSFQDPATVTGTEEKVLAVFRKVRNQIKEKIKLLTMEIKS